MPADDELKSREFAEYLEADEKLLYTGHGNTGSIFRFSLSVLAPLMGWNKKDPLKQWRVALTDRRVLLVRRDSKEERSARFDELTQVELKRSFVNRTLILQSRDADDIELGLPRARNDYGALEQALGEAAPHLMTG